MVKPISVKEEDGPAPEDPRPSASAVDIPPAVPPVTRSESSEESPDASPAVASIPLRPEGLLFSVTDESPERAVSASLNSASVDDVAPAP